MWLDKNFEVFDSRIKLNPDREARIRSAYDNLADFLKKDRPLAEAFLDFFRQGSFAINTAIRPLEEGREFDLDCLFVMDAGRRPADGQSPTEIISWVANRLRQHEDYEGKVRERTRCVRIVYAREFHVDVVPGRIITDLESPLTIPSKTDGWQKSHPRGFVNWALALDKTLAGKFAKVVRILKYWRDLKLGNETKPKSILITTLLGQSLPPSGTSFAEVLVLTMETLSEYLDNQLFVPRVSNPSLPEEDLARDWREDEFGIFRSRLHTAATTAREALDCANKDRERSLGKWITLFGEKFPRLTEEDGRRHQTAANLGGLFVTPSGKVSTERPSEAPSVAIKKHRFYGQVDSCTWR